MTEWWRGLAPVHTTVACNGSDHRIEWSAGELRAVDHDDVDGDRTLVALGGDGYPCLSVIDAWHRHREDLLLVLLASRGPSDPIRRLGAGDGASRSGWFMGAPNQGVIYGSRPSGSRRVYTYGSGGVPTPPTDGQDLAGIAGLLSLGNGISRRLVATITQSWRERVEDNDDRASDRRAELEAALVGRVTCAVREWLDEPSAIVDVVMDDGARSVARTERGYLVTVPFAWLVDVWARGLSVFADGFCVGARNDVGRSELDVVDRELGRRTVVITST